MHKGNGTAHRLTAYTLQGNVLALRDIAFRNIVYAGTVIYNVGPTKI